MKLSVIVPVYKVEKYLAKCIDSILVQSFSDFEMILVDDGSPDSCPAICDEYAKKDDRVRVIHQTNQGLSAARNTGIENAKGEYLAFIDSDDYISENMFSVLIENAAMCDADISICDAVLVNEDDICTFTDQTERKQLTGKEALIDMIYYRKITVNAWNKIYKKTLFGDIRYPRGMLYEDLATTYKLIEKCKVVVVSDAKLYAYVQRTGSIMNRTGYKVNPDKVVITYQMMQHLLEKETDKDNKERIIAGGTNYLLNDIYKMSSTGNLSDNVEYLSELRRFYSANKRFIRESRYISGKQRSVLKLSISAPVIMEWLYFRLRRVTTRGRI